MRACTVCVFLGLITCSSACGIDCNLSAASPGGPSSIEFHWTGPLRSVRPIEADQEQGFFPGLSFADSEGPVELQIDFCGGFDLDGDFSELPIWEFTNVEWTMIGSPDNESSLLGNLLDPSPASSVFLPERVSSITDDLGNNVFQTSGEFDIEGLAPGKYLIGMTGKYTMSEVAIGESDIRVREDVRFEYGFPLTIVPEPSTSATGLIGALLIAQTLRRRRRFRTQVEHQQG